MNLLHSKLRNRIPVAVMDKLCFIYINSRSLRRERGLVQSDTWDGAIDEVEALLLNIEDDMMLEDRVDQYDDE